MGFRRLGVTAMGLVIACLLGGCLGRLSNSAELGDDLRVARERHRYEGGVPASGRPIGNAPGVFETIRYPSDVGELEAFVTPDPRDGRKHPAIVWITGGESNTIDASLAEPASPDNDQTAAAYREAGIVLMLPSLRGGNANPGRREGFRGEVDDIMAAGKYVAGLPYVDPQRIYLGGHSTGGTLALLVAACTDQFREVIAFGPVAEIRDYRGEFIPPGPMTETEYRLRSPIYWLDGINTPTTIIEGVDDGNALPLSELAKATRNRKVRCIAVKNADHFSVLAPVNAHIARKIRAGVAELDLAVGELQALFSR